MQFLHNFIFIFANTFGYVIFLYELRAHDFIHRLLPGKYLNWNVNSIKSGLVVQVGHELAIL